MRSLDRLTSLMPVLGIALIAALPVLAMACSADPAGGGGSNDDDDTTGGAGGSGSGGTGGLDLSTTGTAGSGNSSGCASPPEADQDADGFTGAMGDCNDCDANVNPGAVEVIDPDPMAPAADEDCSGMPDDIVTCDDTLLVDDMDPMSAAKAVELCQASSGAGQWGVVSAKWVMVDGSPENGNPNFHLGHGILTGFGPNVNVQGGSKLLALSSGTARQPTDVGYMSPGGFDKMYTSNHPQGFPKESPACPGSITGQPHDGTAVELVVQVPTNAQGFSFDFNFYTFEWPGWICTQYNDFFVALLTPIPMGQTDGNISFDSQGNPVSVNNAFVEVCGCFNGPPCIAGGKTYTCALGAGELVGTGFGIDAGSDHAATSWLKTTAPADPGSQITIRWGVYDSGDGVLDSTTLIDNWQWTATPGTIGTNPIEDPK